jgi:hypothetical protein
VLIEKEEEKKDKKSTIKMFSGTFFHALKSVT